MKYVFLHIFLNFIHDIDGGEKMNQFTEKDLAYITDMFSWNSQALKLANHFLEETKDEEVAELLENIMDMHYENLEKCVAILKGEREEAGCYQAEEYDDEDSEEDEEEEDA